MDVPWRLPLMQAPIGPATTPELVIAVARVGALGTLAAAWTEPEVLRDQIREVKSAIDVPFCVNLVLAFDQEERLEVVVREGGAVRVLLVGTRRGHDRADPSGGSLGARPGRE